MKKLRKYKINVEWEDFDKDLHALADAKLYAISIKKYILLFKKLPDVGVCISDGINDSATVERIWFNGIDKIINVTLTWK